MCGVLFPELFPAMFVLLALALRAAASPRRYVYIRCAGCYRQRNGGRPFPLGLCAITFAIHISPRGGECAGTKGHKLNHEELPFVPRASRGPNARAALTRPAAGRPIPAPPGQWTPHRGRHPPLLTPETATHPPSIRGAKIAAPRRTTKEHTLELVDNMI